MCQVLFYVTIRISSGVKKVILRKPGMRYIVLDSEKLCVKWFPLACHS